MQITYINEVTGRSIVCHGEDAVLAVQSPLFKRWVGKLSTSIEVSKIFFQSVDVAGRRSPKERVLFIKFIAIAVDARRRPLLPGIVVLRGNSVACLVVLKNRGKHYTVLVKQARLAMGDEILEIPAGMQDDGDDPCGTTLRELEEEVGLTIDRAKIVQLTQEPLYTSPGLIDEAIHLYATKLKVSDKELAAMRGRVHGCVDEHEHIELEIVEIHDIPKKTADAKTRTAYEIWARQGN